MKPIILLTVLLCSPILFLAQSADCSYGGTGLTVGSSCTTTTFDSNDNTDYWNSASGCSGSDNDDAWHWFTATATSTTITYNSTNDAILHVFTGACATTMTALSCANSTTSGDESITLATTIGTNYAIRIQRNASDQNMSGTICVTSPLANDLCSGAVSVSCGNTYSGTTVGMTNTGETALPSCSSTSPSAPGVWYVLTGDGSTVTASLCSGTSYDSKINVYSGASCASLTSCIASNDDGCGSQSTVTFSTTIGTLYYILVNGYSSATGTYSLALTCCTPALSNCATSPSPATNATGVSSCTNIGWTAPVNSGCTTVSSYDLYFGTTNPPPFYGNTTVTSYSIPTVPGTKYYWQIRPVNSMGSPSSCTVWNFTTATNPNTQYTMVDDATSPTPYSCVVLTSTTNDQRGCAWDMNSTLNFASSFTYDFTVNLGSSDAGADGMAFVMQNDPLGRCKCGTTGGSIGAGGITNSVIVEIDTYINTEDRDDFSSNFIGCSGTEDPDHLDIWFNGAINPDTDGSCSTSSGGERPATPTAVRLKDAGSNYNIENGSDHILRISWSSATQTLTATVLNTALNKTYGTITSTFNPLTVFGTNTPYFGFTASTGGLNNTQSFCNPASLLPVELISFHSYCYEEATKIYWSTASETNNDYFLLQKSLNGILYEDLAKIPAAGQKSSESNYEFSDPDKTAGVSYYRLVQVDLNGESETYDAIASSCYVSDADKLHIENIHASDNEGLSFVYVAPDKQDRNIAIYAMNGILISEFTHNGEKGANEISLDKLYLKSGLYFIRILDAEHSASAKYRHSNQ